MHVARERELTYPAAIDRRARERAKFSSRRLFSRREPSREKLKEFMKGIIFAPSRAPIANSGMNTDRARPRPARLPG